MPIASNTVNAIAMTVLPDAPVDPATGLRVPTIAVATNGGVSAINDDGIVRNSANTGAFIGCSFMPNGDLVASAGNIIRVATRQDYKTASFNFSLENMNPSSTTPRWSVGVTAPSLARVTNRAILGGASTGAFIMHRNRSNGSRSLTNNTTNTFNTGWLPGDIRRAYLSDVEVGTITGPELVTNGGFNTDLAGWYAGFGATDGTFEVVSGRARVSVSGGGFPRYVQAISGLTVGASYEVSVQIASATGAGDRFFGWSTGSDGTVGGATLFQQGVGSAVATRRYVIVPTASTIFVYFGASGVGSVTDYDNISVRRVDLDRSYKTAAANITGTLTKAALATGTSLVGYSGFSASNYLREPYSADLDFGTGEWSCSAWVNVPATLPIANFPAIGAELFADFTTEGAWTDNGNGSWTIASATGVADLRIDFAGTVGKTYRVSFTLTGVSGAQPQVFSLHTTPSQQGNGSYSFATLSNVGFFIVRANPGTSATISNISIREIGSVAIFDRAATSGPRLRLRATPFGNLVAEAFDGTTTRTVTTSATYNTATWLKAEACYTTDGTLSIRVNGREVAATRGNPLLTLNNSNAVLTIGSSFALDAPFPGSIALLKLGATVPTYEQSQFMYEQEKQLFRAGAQSVLPDSGSIVDMAYDDATDRWVAISATNESYWTGLVRNSVTPVPAGSYTRIVAGSGVELAARSTTNPGVDVTIPAYGLREELVKRAEAAARLTKEIVTYDYVGGFTANTTNGSTAITNVSTITYPASYIGARISGAGIPANTTIVAVSGTTIYLSAAATATASGVSISFLDFELPVGMEARTVFNAGVQQREGATAAFTRLYDGFIETIRFGVAPGATALVSIQAQRITMQ